MTQNRLALAVLVTLVGTPVLTGQMRYVPEAQGTWKPWVFRAYQDNRTQTAARAADVKELEAHLRALDAILKKTPGFAAPVGFSVETGGELDLSTFRPGQPALPTLPLPSTLYFGAHGIHEFEQGGKTVRSDRGETPQLVFFINQLTLPLFFSQDRIAEFQELETDVTLLARSQPDLFGMPRYGDTIIFKKTSAPIWSAVSLDEALTLAEAGIARRLTESRDMAARQRKQYDDLKDPAKRAERIAQYKTLAPMSKDPAYMDKVMKAEQQMEAMAATLLGPIADAEKRVAGVEGELEAARAARAARPAAERDAPACYARSAANSLARFRNNPSDTCTAIVRPNWKLFNPALPRSAPQILVIAHYERCFAPELKMLHPGGCVANRKMLETFDRQAILAWLQ